MTTKCCHYAGVLGSDMRISAQNLPKKLSLLLVVPRNIDPLAMVFNSQIQERNGCGSNYHTPKLIVDFLRCEILKLSVLFSSAVLGQLGKTIDRISSRTMKRLNF